MKVVRMRMFTAVFFADMTPRKPRTGCADPPIARTSETVAMINRRSCRDDEAEHDRDEEILDDLLDRLPPLDSAHAEPEEQLAARKRFLIKTA